MKIIDATNLVKKHAHTFSEVYKQYNFKDDDDLRNYLDFITHEPEEWIRGFPMQWKTDANFKSVRAGFHKLLKTPAVISEYGEEYCENVGNTVWNVFKTHMEAVVNKRVAAAAAAPLLSVEDLLDESESIHSMHSVRRSRVGAPSSSDWERKYRILESAYKELITGDEDRLQRSALVLLEGLSNS